MNRKAFLALKEKTEAKIAKKNARVVELQHTVEACDQKIAINTATMNEAEAEDDPGKYSGAFALVNMYKERKKKAEEEQAAGFRDPSISTADWKEIVDFLSKESDSAAEEERAEIWGLLSRIEEIIDRYDKYYHELALFANECDNANNANFTGAFRPIVVGRLPVNWLLGIKESAQYFRPKTSHVGY